MQKFEQSTVSNIAEQIYQKQRSIDWKELIEYSDHDRPTVDIRLQVREFDGYEPVDWRLWVGDPSYDTDHRGYWGADYLVPDMTEQDCRDTTERLLNEAQEHYSMTEGMV